MNTKKLSQAKRISVVLDKPSREMLLKMSLRSGKSMSAVLRDVVNHGFESVELFNRLKNN